MRVMRAASSSTRHSHQTPYGPTLLAEHPRHAVHGTRQNVLCGIRKLYLIDQKAVGPLLRESKKRALAGSTQRTLWHGCKVKRIGECLDASMQPTMWMLLHAHRPSCPGRKPHRTDSIGRSRDDHPSLFRLVAILSRVPLYSRSKRKEAGWSEKVT